MRTLHVISHTHWDREWYRTFQQFRIRLVHLIDGLLDLLEQDPNFKHFMLDGQTIVLDDYLLMRPEKENILHQHIQNGRILIGPWHILPDMFLVGPEAHIRNLLQGEQTTRRFGPKMMVGYIPDPFGHPAQVPQILRGFGINTCCVWRGLDDQPVEFWWRGPDGSRVLMIYLRDSYSNGASLPTDDPPAFTQAITRLGESLAAHSVADDYLIMLGTDHMEPPPKTSAAITYANNAQHDWHVIHSTLPTYLAALHDSVDLGSLPIVKGELRASKRMHLLPGVLSTRMWIKQRNRASENLLIRWVEPFTTFAALLDDQGELSHIAAGYLRHPANLVRQAWRLLMENHPHDSICGCSLDQVHEEMKPRFDQVDQISEELIQLSLVRLAGEVHTQADLTEGLAAIVVFNPLAFKRSDVVRVELVLPPDVSGFEIIDEKGDVLTHETLGLGAQELVNAKMTPADLRTAFGMISEGRVMGMGIQTFTIRRIGDEGYLEVTFSQAEPDKGTWERAVREVQEQLADPSLRGLQVVARTADVIQVVFTAPDVPGLGWRTFFVLLKEKQSSPVSIPKLMRILLPLVGRLTSTHLGTALLARLQPNPANQPPYMIENEFFSVEVEPSGTISIKDKRDGHLYSGINRFTDGGDCGDTYNYSPPFKDSFVTAQSKHISVQRGAVQQHLIIDLILHIPARLNPNRQSRSSERVEIPIRSIITLTPGLPRVDIHSEIDNRAYDHRLRVHFPTPFHVNQVVYDGHFMIDHRSLHLPEFDRQTWVEDPRPEVPQRAYTHVASIDGGFTLANRGLPEIEAIDTSHGVELALTLLRCVGWLSRDDYITRRGNAGTTLETPGAQMIGKWSFDYAICPHPPNSNAFPHEFAYAFETPLRAICTSLHSGILPSKGTFVSIEVDTKGNHDRSAAFILSAIKQAEDGKGWLLRGFNASNEPVTIHVRPNFRSSIVSLVNLAEQHLTDLVTDHDTGLVSLDVGGNQIITLLFTD